jgi:hypothetical protein
MKIIGLKKIKIAMIILLISFEYFDYCIYFESLNEIQLENYIYKILIKNLLNNLKYFH